MEKFCLEESTVEVSKYFSGSKIKDRSSHVWLLFFFYLPFLQFLCLNSAKTSLPPPVLHIKNIWVLRMSG